MLKTPDNEIYRLLRDERVDEANALLDSGMECDFRGAFLRGFKLQGLHAAGLDFTDAYFRLADLRGLDLRDCRLHGASLHGAKIHGVYFPVGLSAEEIMLSVEHGTRLRYGM